MLGLLDKTRLGVLHLDRRGRIVAVNDRAGALLRQGDGLADRAGELVAGIPAEHSRLARLVADALPTSSTPAVSGSLLLRRAAARPRLVVHVIPVGSQQWAFGAHEVAALVLVVEPGYAPRLEPTVVAAALGLTATESQIAVLLAAGQTVREIAVGTGRPPPCIGTSSRAIRSWASPGRRTWSGWCCRSPRSADLCHDRRGTKQGAPAAFVLCPLNFGLVHLSSHLGGTGATEWGTNIPFSRAEDVP